MDILMSKTFTVAAGFTSVSTGINLADILKVCRQGIQLDQVTFLSLGSSNRSWAFLNFGKRIVVKADSPFVSGEEIFVIYKVTT
jgi:hypothetical protein